MQINGWLTLFAILVALFGERIWRFIDNRKKKNEVRAIIKNNLEQLKADLLWIRDARNRGKTNATDTIIFNSTSFSEVNGYSFLFSDLLLPNLDQFELSKYPATIEFFNHYKINMETIRKRESDRVGTGLLTLATVNKLLGRLAIDLTKRFGRSFSKSNLFQMRMFYVSYAKKFQTLSGISRKQKMQTLSAQLP